MSRDVICFRLGAAARSIVDYDASLRIDPKFAAALYGRGVAKLEEGDSAGGHADIDAAKAIQSNIAELFVKYYAIAP